MVSVPHPLLHSFPTRRSSDLVQLAALKLPVTPAAVKATEPAGVVAPAPLVSATDAEHTYRYFTPRLPWLYTFVLQLVRRVLAIVSSPAALLELSACAATSAVYV